jgi:hypothetical protein
MADRDVTRLLFDGIRLILQVTVERADKDRVAIPRELRDDIQAWYDRCYELLEGSPPPSRAE